MSIFFTGAEIIEVAIRIEKNGKEFYESLAETYIDKKVNKIFKYLAKEENQHVADFNKLYEIEKKTDIFTPYGWEEASQYYNALASSYVFTETNGGTKMAKQIKDPQSAIDMAIKFEEDSVLFYIGIRNSVLHDYKNVIQEIINQEKTHQQKLEKINEELICSNERKLSKTF